MQIYVALLRAVNVGGTGTLAMKDLVALCLHAGCEEPRTYIASGNVVLGHPGREHDVKAALEAALQAHAGQSIRVLVRTGPELDAILGINPFADTNPAHTVAVFLDQEPSPNALESATGWAGEKARIVGREIFIHYGAGMGRSKLKIPAALAGTARNLNTVAKLALLARERAGSS